MAQKSIYIILTRTSTVLSRLISHITGDTYTHASIALGEKPDAMYSFGRKRRHNPFVGGFCRENLDEGVFAYCKTLPYIVIQINVTQEQHDKAALLIQAYIQNAHQYRYNFTGLLFAWVGKAYKRSNSFYCSEFVYDLLKQCEIVHEIPQTVIRPQDLMRHGHIIAAGDWKLMRNKTDESGLRKLGFMQKPLISPI